MDIKPNITCTVCGENEFHLKEGYYYCDECGTKSEQVRAVEVEQADEFEDVRNRKSVKIKKESIGKPELTSWECYNYILRGIVEELINMGARDELKVMALQIWAAYLRNREVAFFSRRHPELPKLGIRYERRDVTILYNHAKERKKQKRSETPTTTKAASSKREWNRQMKKFDQSQYESSMSQSIHSSSFLSQSSFGNTSGNSSGSAPTNRAIQLKFSSTARKQLKKKMPPAHVKKHEQDYDQSLTCHNIPVKLRDLKFCDQSMELNMKQLYAVIAVALNLIGDDIQLTDLMRFVAEGHISSQNMEQFFPDNMSEHYKDTLASYRFHVKYMHFSVASMRIQSSLLCKAIHISSLKRPDILKLIQRYITELYLPFEIYTFIERLVNLHPPQMDWDRQTTTPCYESRAMAYIIFTLKLLFGLDGRKEKQISKSAKRVNAQLGSMELENYDPLFVWDNWVKYIEMRKVILCKHSLPFCKQFKQVPSRELYLRQLSERSKIAEKPLSKNQKQNQENMEIVFKKFLQTDGEPAKEEGQFKFTPSFTPCHNYFNHIKLDPEINASIPDFMQIDHSSRSLLPLLKPTKLKDLFASCGRKLNVIRVSCTDKLNLVGTFRNPFLFNLNRYPHKVNLDNDQNAWAAKVNGDKPAESIFNPVMEKYGRVTLHTMRKKQFNRQDTSVSIENEPKVEIGCNQSIDLFQESDMEPAAVNITAPRRHLERINLFAEVSDDEIDGSEDENNLHDNSTTTTLKISNIDCWLLMGKAFELSEVQSIELKSKLPLTFFWLLEMCANILSVEWTELYDQLMVLEMFFAHGIQPLDQFEDRIIFKPENEIKDINKIVRHFKTYW